MNSKEVTESFKQLNKVNKDYYQKLVEEVHFKTLGKDYRKVNKILKNVLRDILTAQNNNILAEDFIGNDIEKIADEISNKVPFNHFETFKLIIYGLMVYSIFAILPCLLTENNVFDLGTFIITVAYFTAYSLVLLLVIARGKVYSNTHKYSTILNSLLITAGFCIGLLIFWFIETPLKMKFEGTIKYIALIFMLFIFIVLFIKEERKRLWLPFLPILIFCTLLGVVARMDIFKLFFWSITGKILVASLLLLVAATQYIALYRHFKSASKKD